MLVSNSLGPYRLGPAKLPCPWDFLGKNTEVGCHFLLQWIFLTQGWNLHLLHWQADFFFTTERPGKPMKRCSILHQLPP